MSVDQEILVNGHLAQQLLREYAECPDDFDDDAVEEIWQHLDMCEDCIEDFEAIREGRLKEKPADDPGETEPPDDQTLEADAFDPDDLAGAKVETKQDDGEHINGLMPVGDDPTRNGVPDEYKNGDKNRGIETESPIDAATESAEEPSDEADTETEPVADDETAPVADDVKSVDETDDDSRDEDDEIPEASDDEPDETPEPPDDEPDDADDSSDENVIEGLITGEVLASDEPADQLETETAVEAGERIAQEQHQKTDEPAEQNTAEHDPGPEPESAAEEPSADVEPVEEPEDDPFIAPAEPAEPPEMSKPGPRPTAPAQPATPARPAKQARPAAAAKSEPLEDLLKKVFAALAKPRNAIICGSVIVLTAAALVYALVFAGGKDVSPVAGWAPLDVIETRVPLQEVLIRKMRNGRIARARGTDVTLDFRGVDKLVIAVDLDFIKGKQLPYELIVRDPDGTGVFQEQIPQEYLDDGRFFLRLIPKQFELDQTYKLELISHRADGSNRVVAESVFDVLK
jgi:hypothetical protein